MQRTQTEQKRQRNYNHWLVNTLQSKAVYSRKNVITVRFSTTFVSKLKNNVQVLNC